MSAKIKTGATSPNRQPLPHVRSAWTGISPDQWPASILALPWELEADDCTRSLAISATPHVTDASHFLSHTRAVLRLGISFSRQRSAMLHIGNKGRFSARESAGLMVA